MLDAFDVSITVGLAQETRKISGIKKENLYINTPITLYKSKNQHNSLVFFFIFILPQSTQFLNMVFY